MDLGEDLVEAVFLRRVNRFLALVALDGRETEVHVANSGRLKELFVPGARVWVKPATQNGRKTAFDLALVKAEGTLVSADARLPNALVAEALQLGVLKDFGKLLSIQRERTFGESRFDMMLQGENFRQFVEVKSVTLLERGVGLFPDSPTIRGAKHLNGLVDAVKAGNRGTVVFVIQRGDATAFAVNEPADPSLANAFLNARANGVEAYAYSCVVTEREVRLDRKLPIVAFETISSRTGRQNG